PALLLGALAVIVVGIFVAMRGDGLGLDGVQRSEVKREIIRQLRANVGGLTTDALADSVAMRSRQVAMLLAEMLRDNVVERHDAVWRMKD
ncbi:MAG: hypothetical protein JNG84_10315, partial [Archangium sp.]|nr:hypothetical protein [Archangium sp.]